MYYYNSAYTTYNYAAGALGILVVAVVLTAFFLTFGRSILLMFGASAMKLVKFGLDFTGPEIAALLLGVVVAFLVSLAVIRFLMAFVKRHDFQPFGWYRIVLGAVVLFYFFGIA